MIVLGIHDGHCSTACLLIDEKIVACASEERFTEKKNQSGIPKKAIDYCLKEAEISTNDLDILVLATKFMAPIYNEEKSQVYSLAQKIRKPLYKVPFLHSIAYKAVKPSLQKSIEKKRIENLAKHLGLDKSKIITQEHHLAHAYTCLYGSGFLQKRKDFLILTLDGEGDGLCATVNVVKNGKMERISQTSNAYSIGLLYGEITRYLGMKILEHEFKVMGLAPYATDSKRVEEVYNILKEIIWIDGLEFKGTIHSHTYQKFLQEKLKFKRFDHIARAIQNLTEDLVLLWIKNCIKKTGLDTVACAGGVFMNVKLNQKILELPEIKELFIFPSCGDESLAIGACYYGYENLCEEKEKKCTIEPLQDLYFGPAFEWEPTEKDKEKYIINKYDNIEEKIAELLANGEIVARCSGRMEWGARALGNRSILADASKEGVVREINEAIKCRDFWMPFCPVIMAGAADTYIINPKGMPAPYMIISFNSTERAKRELKGAMHPYDFTLRPQIIQESWNPSYYKILELFKEKTGKCGLLNTSFNIHGYPIVLGPKQALYVLENSGLKNLIINNYLIRKK